MAALTLSDGIVIDIDAAGHGRPVAFIHGWAVHSGLFNAQRAAFAHTNRVVAFDLRGHGQSRRCPKPPTIERLGADLCEIFEALDLADVICVGWSMGAMVVWEAMANPAFMRRVGGLVVVDMSPRISNDASWSLGLADGRGPQATIRAADAMRRDWPTMVRQFVPRIFAPDAAARHHSLIDEIINDACALNPEDMACLWESMAVQDFRKFIAEIDTPTLVVHGALSQLYSQATSEYIVATAKRAKISTFAQSGHAPHLEEPEAFNLRLRNFIDETDQSSHFARPQVIAARQHGRGNP